MTKDSQTANPEDYSWAKCTNLAQGKMTVMDQPFIDKAVDLAGSIAHFKTREMELAFADFLRKATNPPILVEKSDV